jgi:CDP-diglyceride synthetase
MSSTKGNHPHPHPSPSESGEGFFKGMMIGVLLGVGLWWFFGTESGRRARGEMQKGSGDWLNRAQDFLADLDAEDEMDEEYADDMAMEPSTAPPSKAATAPKGRRFFRRPGR